MTAPRFSGAERAPASSPRYAERSTRRLTLAFRVFGKAETKWIFEGSSGVPMSPSFSHDGRRIAFVTNRDGNTAGFHLYTMNVDGSEQRRIYPKEALVFSPAWLSVDEVLFAGNRTDDGNFELFYLSIGDPESERQLTSQRLSDLQRAVSPDGNKIIFNSDRSGKIALYTIDLSSN